MARFAASVTLQNTSGIATFSAAGGCSDPVNGATTAADQAAVESAVAVLEADGVAPTQAHVNSLRTVWNTLKADIALVPAASDVVVSVNSTPVVTRSRLRQALRQIELIFEGSSALTP